MTITYGKFIEDVKEQALFRTECWNWTEKEVNDCIKENEEDLIQTYKSLKEKNNLTETIYECKICEIAGLITDTLIGC